MRLSFPTPTIDSGIVLSFVRSLKVPEAVQKTDPYFFLMANHQCPQGRSKEAKTPSGNLSKLSKTWKQTVPNVFAVACFMLSPSKVVDHLSNFGEYASWGRVQVPRGSTPWRLYIASLSQTSLRAFLMSTSTAPEKSRIDASSRAKAICSSAVGHRAAQPRKFHFLNFLGYSSMSGSTQLRP